MLSITIPATEYYDEVNDSFINIKEQVLILEHSLVSISKWEAKWHFVYDQFIKIAQMYDNNKERRPVSLLWAHLR